MYPRKKGAFCDNSVYMIYIWSMILGIENFQAVSDKYRKLMNKLT